MNVDLNLPQDCRPEFNGEFRCFWWLLQNFDIKNPLIIGAVDDYHYLQAKPHAKWTLVEPSSEGASRLSAYCKSQLINADILQHALTANAREVIIYDNGSIFSKKSTLEINRLVGQGLIKDSYLLHQINTSSYLPNKPIAKLPSIIGSDVIAGPFDFVKIDVEGAECEIISSLLPTFSNNVIVQYEYNSTWIHANKTHADMFSVLDGYHHYAISPFKLVPILKPIESYFYANFLASPFSLPACHSYGFF